MKIYDCFQFFNEENILDLRLNILDEFVNFFVIVELIATTPPNELIGSHASAFLKDFI